MIKQSEVGKFLAGNRNFILSLNSTVLGHYIMNKSGGDFYF
jgi:hypothetical protein